MLKNKNIICIASIDWDFVWQGHQEIMSTFAKNGNRVLFIENTGIRVPTLKDFTRLRKRVLNWLKSVKGFRQEMKNLYVYSPLALPFPYSRIARYINRYFFLRALKRWMKIMDFYNPIIWTFLPTGIALDIIENIDGKLLVYYCIADFYKLVSNEKKVKKTEDELIKKSDLIFVQGKVLYDKCKALNKNVYIYPFGVNIEVFENFQYSSDKILFDIKNIKKPIIGYIGGVHKHIDFMLLRYMAEAHPDWSIVLVGPIQTKVDEINYLKNIFLLGKKSFFELPYYISEFNVCIIPYLKTEYTATVYPTKLNEYHAIGKPVVSTELPEVKNFNLKNDNLILIGKDYKEFTDHIERMLNDTDELLIGKRLSSAKKNCWITRINEMSNLIEKAIVIKDKTSTDWRENFKKLYKTTQRNVLKFTFISLSLYFLIFYTPLIWFLAHPLKISQVPEKADCIIVLGGGVGESGRVGQGYEERVQYAVELYKKGYSSNLIYSSGYMYVFKEPLVMEALSVSLGVPENAILLEYKAKNTYENIKFTKEILDKKNWKKILLVSSPYHMRRLSLVINKVAPEIKTIYTPIPKSQFYSHGVGIKGRKTWKQINSRQIEGILHEYLGIIYYYFKGYI